MVPVCCVCGVSAKKWHDDEWYEGGGMQDFCPTHAALIQNENGQLQQYLWGNEINPKGLTQ